MQVGLPAICLLLNAGGLRCGLSDIKVVSREHEVEWHDTVQSPLE